MDRLPLALYTPDPQITIRHVSVNDVDGLHFNCWRDRPYTSLYNLISRAVRMAKDNRGLGAVYVENDHVLGYGQLTMWPNCSEISDLIVAEQLHSRGIGTALIQYLVQAARDMHVACIEIGVAKENPRALALYRRLGFEDSHTMLLDMGRGKQAVLYLRLAVRK